MVIMMKMKMTMTVMMVKMKKMKTKMTRVTSVELRGNLALNLSGGSALLPFHLRKGDEDCDGNDGDINQPQQCECGDFIEIVDSPSPNKLVFWFVGPIAFVNRRLCDSKSSSPTHSQVETVSIE